MEDAMNVSPATLQDGEEQNQIKRWFSAYSLLSPKKQARVKKLVELFWEADSEGERDDITNAVSDIIVPVWRKFKMSQPVDLEEGVPDKERKAVDGYFRKVGDTVRDFREKAGMSQTELAEKAGLTQSHVSRLEAGVHAPTQKTIVKIAEALGVEPGKLDLLFNND
jgi:DNA-binding XRE family transcriptional regulator